MKTSNKILIFSFTYLAIFTGVCLFINSKGGVISDELIKWNFVFFGIELLTLGGIKVSKLIWGGNV